MRKALFIHTVIVALLATAAIPDMARSKDKVCSYPLSREIADELKLGIDLIDVLRYLRANEIDFRAFSTNHQRIDILAMSDWDLHRLGKITISITSKNRDQSNLTRKVEFIKLRVDSKSRLLTNECEAMYPGP